MTSAELAVWLDRHSILVTREKVYDRNGADVCIPFMPLEPRGEDEDGRPLYRVFKKFPEPHFTVHRKGFPISFDPKFRLAYSGDAEDALRVNHTRRVAAATDVDSGFDDSETSESNPPWGQSTFAHSVEYILDLIRDKDLIRQFPVPIIPEPAPRMKRASVGTSAVPIEEMWHQPVYSTSGNLAKTQIPEKNFKPAELRSESEWQWYEDQLNATEGILGQDRYGNLPGLHLDYTRRTAPKQIDIDAVMFAKWSQSQQGKSREQLEKELSTTRDADTISILTKVFGMSKEEAAKRLIVKESSVKKIVDRARAAANQPIISQAIANTKPQEAGWYIVIKLKSRPPYLVKLDMQETPTEDQEAFAIWSAKIDEENRMLANKMKEVGQNKAMQNGDLTARGVKILNALRPKVAEAFKQGRIIYLDAVDVALLHRKVQGSVTG